MRSTKLTLGTHLDSGLLYRVYWNQAAGAYSSLYFVIFLSLQLPNRKINVVALFSGAVRLKELELDTHMNNGLMYCAYWTQASGDYCIFFFFFSLKAIKLYLSRLVLTQGTRLAYKKT